MNEELEFQYVFSENQNGVKTMGNYERNVIPFEFDTF